MEMPYRIQQEWKHQISEKIKHSNFKLQLNPTALKPKHMKAFYVCN